MITIHRLRPQRRNAKPQMAPMIAVTTMPPGPHWKCTDPKISAWTTTAMTDAPRAPANRPVRRPIEESRVTESGRSFEQGANDAMLRALMDWVATKTAAEGLDTGRLAALTMNVFGSWLFYLTKRQQGVELAALDRDTLLEDWATRWSGTLDRTS